MTGYYLSNSLVRAPQSIHSSVLKFDHHAWTRVGQVIIVNSGLFGKASFTGV